MGWLDWLPGKGRTHRVETGAQDYSQRALRKHSLRPGRWVMYDRNPGILTALPDEGKASVMLTDAERGEDRLAIECEPAALRQCRWAEIPATRRPDKREAFSMGYDL